MLLRKKLSFHNLFLWDHEGTTTLALSASASPPRAMLPPLPSTGPANANSTNGGGDSGGGGGGDDSSRRSISSGSGNSSSPHDQHHRHEHLHHSKILETMCEEEEEEEGKAGSNDSTTCKGKHRKMKNVDCLQQLVYFRFKRDGQKQQDNTRSSSTRGRTSRHHHQQQQQQVQDTTSDREVDPSRDKAAARKWHWMGYEDSGNNC